MIRFAVDAAVENSNNIFVYFFFKAERKEKRYNQGSFSNF